MLLRVRHVIDLAFTDRADRAAYLLHLRPRNLPWQQVHLFAWRIGPGRHRLAEGEDHFGNAVAWLAMEEAHPSLRVETDAVVDVLPRSLPDPYGTPAWEHVAKAAQAPAAAHAIAEFAFGSDSAPAAAPAREWAAPSFPAGRPVLAGLLDLAARLLQTGAGTSQDTAHLLASGLRGLGLPVRVVSGHLRMPVGPALTHAWASCWLGPAHGWVGLDPVGGAADGDRGAWATGDRHVWLGWGRDYADVYPARGIVRGGGACMVRAWAEIEPWVAGERREQAPSAAPGPA